MSGTAWRVERITVERSALVTGLLDLYATAFEDAESYGAHRPDAVYLQRVLAKDDVIALYTKLGLREDVMHFDIPVPRIQRDGDGSDSSRVQRLSDGRHPHLFRLGGASRVMQAMLQMSKISSKRRATRNSSPAPQLVCSPQTQGEMTMTQPNVQHALTPHLVCARGAPRHRRGGHLPSSSCDLGRRLS